MPTSSQTSIFSPIAEILDELKAGRMIVLVDDEDRENEGDLVIPAQTCTPEIVNFMLTNARGLICVDEEIPAAGSVANGAFRWDDAPEGWKRSVRELAVVLADDWPRLGLSR